MRGTRIQPLRLIPPRVPLPKHASCTAPSQCHRDSWGGSQQQMSTSHTPVPTEQHLKPRYQGTRKFPSWLAPKTVFLALRAILRQASPLSCEQRQMWHLHFSVRTAPSDRFVWTVLFIIQTHVLLLYCLGPGKGSVNMVA